MTSAGRKMLERYLETERAGRLTEVRNGRGDVFCAMRLRAGDGAEKACALRLSKDGLAEAHWGKGHQKFLWLTEAGRSIAGS